MSVVDGIMRRFGFISHKQFEHKVSEAVKAEINRALPVWLSEAAEAYRWNMPDPSIFANQADLYRLSPILGTAIDILGADIGTSKFNVKRMVGEDVRDIPNHAFELLLRNPNPMWSGMELMQYTSSNYKLNGNAVWWLNRAGPGSEPDELFPVPFSMVTPITDRRMGLDHWDFLVNGAIIRLEPWEIIHFKTYNPNNYFIGLSPLESLAETIHGDLGMRKTNRTNYVERNGEPPSILAFKDMVPNEIWDEVDKKVNQAAKKNEMMKLRGVGDGVTWLSRALSNKDNDFIAGLKQNLADVFNRMCPGLIAMLDPNATEANALAARATYAEKTLYPMQEVIAQKITSDILPAYGRKLVGMFEDPRVVDRKLKLEEQSVYERTHVISEVRKEFYQDDPLGDDRDKLFISQLNAQSGDIQEPASSPFQKPQDKQPDDQKPEQIESPEMMNEDEQPKEPTANKAALDDLARYQRKAVKKIGKAVEFSSDALPVGVIEDIRAKLATCTTETAAKAVFDDAREGLKPKVQITDAFAVLEGIRLAVRAMELQKG